MREPRDWDEDYLLNLPVGEFDWLEIKGRRGLDLTSSGVRERDVRQNLSRAISAFANSGGGILVLGLANPITTWQVDDGGVDLTIKSPSTREWLEDIIPNLVDTPLKSFNVYAIQSTKNDSQIHPGKGVFIIEIPDSDLAPHQAFDNKYYARVGGKSRPIGHQLVADIFGRRKYPKIQLEFSIESSMYTPSGPLELNVLPSFGQKHKEPKKKRRVKLRIKARNIGRVLAQYTNCFVYIPVHLIPKPDLVYQYSEGDFETIGGTKYVIWSKRNTHRDVTKAEVFGPSQYGPSWFDPILPALAYTWEWELISEFDREESADLEILWETYADNAPKQTGSTQISDIEFITGE